MRLNQPEITAGVVFHGERAFALPAIDSLRDLTHAVRVNGISVEVIAVMDRPDRLTAELVRSASKGLFDEIVEVDFGDLGLTRNAGVLRAKGKFLAFLDGDDLWGEDWLLNAYRSARNSSADTIWHPEYIYYFDETDFDRHSTGGAPLQSVRSFWMKQVGSDNPAFNRQVLYLNNIWTANCFCRSEVHKRFPYQKVDKTAGFGVEDWSWNISTLWGGVRHLLVPNTVHIIRQKETGSLGRQNVENRLLPYVPLEISIGKSTLQ